VSREARGEKVIGYEDVDEEVMKAHPLVVNCTPLGMSPYENEMPNLPYQWLSTEHWLYDCIYNPEKTLFLQQGIQQGCKIKNGLEMLHLQAEKAWQIWNSI
jgi:shikimate dehydrogenase